jgi:hypothetical protein
VLTDLAESDNFPDSISNLEIAFRTEDDNRGEKERNKDSEKSEDSLAEDEGDATRETE